MKLFEQKEKTFVARLRILPVLADIKEATIITDLFCKVYLEQLLADNLTGVNRTEDELVSVSLLSDNNTKTIVLKKYDKSDIQDTVVDEVVEVIQRIMFPCCMKSYYDLLNPDQEQQFKLKIHGAIILNMSNNFSMLKMANPNDQDYQDGRVASFCDFFITNNTVFAYSTTFITAGSKINESKELTPVQKLINQICLN